jgi:hypothetical protein
VFRKVFAPRLDDRYAGAAAFKLDLLNVLAGAPTVAEQELAAIPTAAVPALAAAEATRRTADGAGAEATRRTATGTDEATRRTATGTGDATRRADGSASEATRRTNGAQADVTQRTSAAGDATRRTAAASNGAATAAPAPSAATSAAPMSTPTATARTGRRRRLIGSFKRFATMGAVALFVNEWFVIKAAGELESRLRTYSRSDAPRAWQEYRALRSRSLLRVGTWELSGQVKNWHVAEADALTADYLSDTPTIRERGWKQAEALLRRASAVDPGDPRVRGRLRYVQGQLARIDGEALLERGGSGARERFNAAQRAFEEAARLRNRWPDPHLGMARVQAIAFADVEQTEDALREAERDGYRRGNRETALMADAHRLRAERMMAAVPGLPDETRYLERIRDDGQQALDLYEQVPAYGQVSRSIRRVHSLLERVEARERALNPAPDPAEDPDWPTRIDWPWGT